MGIRGGGASDSLSRARDSEMRLYSEFAAWWPLVSAPEEYAPYASWYATLLTRSRDAHSVLELGSGGGNNASHLKHRFAMTLVDLSSEMLAVSESINPECEHVRGDMRTIRLGREFDAVFVHDAISLVATKDDLKAVIRTCWEHCAPGGSALLVPDFFQESFAPGTAHGGRDSDPRSLRYLEWAHRDDEAEERYTVDFVFVLRERGRPTRVVHDVYRCGAFSKRTWAEVCSDVGFSCEMVKREEAQESLGAEAVLCRRDE